MAYLKPPWFTRAIFHRIAMATGVKYLVSTRGETEWVRNVRADPAVRVGDVGYLAAEVPVGQRAPIITRCSRSRRCPSAAHYTL